ncbi:hypothetical protein OCU04_004727 [Sclerotinia nivalis]|uniref:Uncharacterized protein n=1 Tax=Sclerotinia nivalis TaxID=352851 RepID=A0A9X0AR15_9HELO|nr:hypothetical protein OCU04_004727 [Sclerotinia nivalis]
MAASHSTTVPNTPDQDRINRINNTIGRRQLLGACNYTELNVGTKCGCYEFWGQSQKSIANATLEDGMPRAEVCACGHHFCFHDPKSSQPTEDQRSRALSNVSGLNVDSIARRAQVNHRPSTPQNMSIPGKDNPEVARRSKNSNFQETLQWSRCVQSETNPEEIPPIPSQCFLPSETASMTSSQARRPFHGLGLNTLSHIPRLNTQGQAVQPGKGRPMQAYKTSDGRTFHESLTEVLTTTPTLLATQDLPFQGVPDERAMDKTLANINIRAQDATLPLLSNRSPSFQASQIRPALNDQGDILLDNFDGPDNLLIPRLREIVTDYPDTKRNHEDRIDALENTSFSNTGFEELQVDINNHNERVYELESRVEELEKANAVADESSIGTNRNLNESFNSQANKASSALVANATDRSNLASRVGSLEDRLTRIEAVLPPSWARPWEIEVVFLPYGPGMMGIWSTNHSMSQRSRVNSCASEDWTQTQQNFLAAAQASLSDQDYSISWEKMLKKGNIDDRTLLMPKACGATSTINERLKSRGLVKVVQIQGPDARDVQVALMSAFEDLPKKLSEDIYSSSRHTPLRIPASMENYLGLRAAWIPLRKLHKTSTLRFLDPSEMVTPALWTVPFLSSSVAMRTKTMRRLYVTQADSYLQHYVSRSSRWTWRKLRQLPRVHDVDAVESHTPEADAAETCWAWDERLDSAEENSSFSTSLSIRLSQEAEDAEIEPTSPSDESSAVDTPVESSTPTSVAVSRVQGSYPVKQDRHPFKPLRTASMSALAPLGTSQIGKRSIGSFDRDREPQSSPIQKIFNLKRRRTSKSPSRPRDTWIIGPPSPGLSTMQEIDFKRGITPSAYATPYSNAPYVETNSRTKGSPMQEDDEGSMAYDTNMDEGFDDNALSDDGASDQDHQPYDVWEGTADNVPHQDSQSTIKMSVAGLRSREPMVDDGDESDSSDTPSEYPSTLPVGNYIKGGIFQIHVDEDFEDELG